MNSLFTRVKKSVEKNLLSQDISGKVKKRKVLVIQAHPVYESYSSTLLVEARRGLKEAGHDLRVRRLYWTAEHPNESYAGSNFGAAMTEEEHRCYFDGTCISKDVAEAVQDLQWCNSIIFIYPTWWFCFPAILKGYFDRVLLPHVSMYSRLEHIKKIGVITTYGAPAHLVEHAGDSSRRFIKYSLLPMFSTDCSLDWMGLYSMDSSDEEDTATAAMKQRQEFLSDVRYSCSKF
mmetsp:Transcript_14907/g.22428  ORF Transcript_14907/g.22428 Transcript_14907/m.22428 type:complete len:233 (-) Transcript_14907:268-966(-)